MSGDTELLPDIVDTPIWNEHDISSKAIYFDAYYGYYGDSSVSMFNNDFYVECLVKAINKHLPELIEETEKIMTEKYNKTLLDAKVEAEDIIAKVKELGLA